MPKPRVDECFALVAGARALLVLGSSLAVRSGLRFVGRAAELGIPIAIVNQGPTRGDAEAALRLDAPLGATLTELTTRLPPSDGSVPPSRHNRGHVPSRTRRLPVRPARPLP